MEKRDRRERGMRERERGERGMREREYPLKCI